MYLAIMCLRVPQKGSISQTLPCFGSLGTFENCQLFCGMSLGDLSRILLILGLGLVTKVGRHQKLKYCLITSLERYISVFITVAANPYRQNGVFTRLPMVGHLHFPATSVCLSEHHMQPVCKE